MIGYGIGKIIFKLPPFWISNKELNSNSNENKNTNKHISVAAKYNITLYFPALDIPPSIGRKAGISK